MEKQKVTAILLVVVIVAVILAAGVYIWQQSKSQPNQMANPVTTENKTDLAACGFFPQVSGDGGPTSRYFVCRNVNTGDCYYKTSYFQQIKGCDPKFSDDNPYGNEKCFQNLIDIYNFSGTLVEKGKSSYRTEDNCAVTEQKYFESKTKK